MDLNKTVYRVARNRQELEEAFSLVYKEYLNRGYIPKGYKSNLRLSIFNALPTTTTFVGVLDKKVLASATLIPDSPLGIPMDKLYKKEVDIIRNQGRKVAEVSQLAIDINLFGKGFFSMFNFNKLIFVFRLFKVILDYAKYVDKITDFCIAINPKQQYLYKFLQFEQIGPLRYYGFVNQAPAIALRLTISNLEKEAQNRKGLYKIFFADKTESILFKAKYKLTSEDLRYFFIEKSDIFKKASKEQLDFIKTCYPTLDFDKLLK